MKRLLLILLLLSLSISLEAGSGTVNTLIVRVDANGYLLVTSATQTNPITQGVFSNRVLKTDANGSLQVVLTGTVTPTYPLAIPASNCAAPSLGLSGNTDNGFAFTATPSILGCIDGTIMSTLNANGLIVGTGANVYTGTAYDLTVAGSPTSSRVMYAVGNTAFGEWHTIASDASFSWTETGVADGRFAILKGGGISLESNLFLSSESADVLQLGLDAAGVSNQMLKGPDRITSDGVGGNLTIAGGRNRGASAGGSLIFQTSPAAGAGVTGTLATALTIDSTKWSTFVAGASFGTNPAVGVIADGNILNFPNALWLKWRNNANNADLPIIRATINDEIEFGRTIRTFDITSATSDTYSITSYKNIVNLTGYIEQVEMTAPAAPAANNVRIYTVDNGAGKTQLCAIFSSGAAQCFATQP